MVVFHENKTQSIWMDPGRILHDSLYFRMIYIYIKPRLLSYQ